MTASMLVARELAIAFASSARSVGRCAGSLVSWTLMPPASTLTMRLLGSETYFDRSGDCSGVTAGVPGAVGNGVVGVADSGHVDAGRGSTFVEETFGVSHGIGDRAVGEDDRERDEQVATGRVQRCLVERNPDVETGEDAGAPHTFRPLAKVWIAMGLILSPSALSPSEK
ncbi:hypothetical protein [Nocardia fluminea]|uniref:hypothetical protein n=1 Tax=Nocardia fluminea TaxID=134984 RepID=UPI00117C84E7|nr:hypothetical protein [Nocardia fluminea]